MNVAELDYCPATIVEGLQRLRGCQTNGFTFLEGDKEVFYSYARLCEISESRARALLAAGCRPGDRIAIIAIQPGDFILTFFSTLFAGLVPVPMFPPLSFGRLDAYIDGAVNILQTAKASLLICDRSLSNVLWQVVPRVAGLRNLHTVEEVAAWKPGNVELPLVTPDDLALLQFTSGSTSTPKGVRVLHRSLAVNCWANASEGMGMRMFEERAVSWLPLYHDMGLIGAVMSTMLKAVNILFIPTTMFVRRPNIWMQKMSEFRAGFSFGPNFAFALAARRATDADIARWDLSCVRFIGCGAEPINPDVIDAFQERFAACGMPPNVVTPAYGMAEATLGVSFHRRRTPMKVQVVDADTFQQEGKIAAVKDDSLALRFVSCGPPFASYKARVVDSDGRVLPEGHEGELMFSGPSVADGYWENPEATAAIFQDGWLRTGDLGFLKDGEVYITGRCKDLIILNGRNHHPQTIEWLAAEVEGVRKGNVVAFSRPGADTEELVVACEVKDDAGPELSGKVQQHIAEQLGLKVSEVVVLQAGQLPKTSSGKLQRRKTREQYLSGALGQEGVRTFGASGEKLNVARHVGRSVLGRVSHVAGRLFSSR